MFETKKVETKEIFDESGTLVERIVVTIKEPTKNKGFYIPINDKMKVINSENDKTYIEFDGIRLIIQDGELIGWYEPNLDRVL